MIPAGTEENEGISGREPPALLLRDLAVCGLKEGVWGTGELAQIPRESGAYLLLVGLAGPRSVALGGRGELELDGGWYAYGGSAKGPGGLRARVARHFRRGKPRHWHIDQLTDDAYAIAALAVPGGKECALVRRLAASGAFATALPGFGSSDCRSCEGHLLTWNG